jgi:acetoacetyl-CoA reductase
MVPGPAFVRPGISFRSGRFQVREVHMSRVAVVTGGTRGIGRAISVALKNKGYRVAANYGGNDVAARQFQAETGIPVFKWDVGDFASCEHGVAQIARELGPIDVLVNNAGITRDSMVHRMSKDAWSAVIRTNLDSVFNMTRLVIEGMRARGFGRIVNISSINGRKGQAGQANYSAAKAGILGFTKAVALENASRGITCNALAPGYIATEMVQAVPKDILETKILPQIPVGRLGTAEEIARCVVFLAADEASFITGACLDANGGQYMPT